MRAKNLSLLSIFCGLVVGCGAYSLFRTWVPSVIAVGPCVIGVCTGVGARLGRAFGTPKQLRIIIFGGLTVFFAAEYGVYMGALVPTSTATYVDYLFQDPSWLAFSLVFLVCGMLFGIRILVGNDALGDLIAHGNNPIGPGGTGSECPRCDGLQTILDNHSLTLQCHGCGHTWRCEAEAAEP